MSDDAVEFNTKGLDQLLKALSGRNGTMPQARVGVLGNKNSRKDVSTNAAIGAKHEFGDDGLPIRSFLRMPITNQMQKFLENSNFFTKEVLNDIIQSGSIEEWIKKIGIVGEQIVAEAFNTGGFGEWKPSNMMFKNNHQTLVETQQLRNSITSDVK